MLTLGSLAFAAPWLLVGLAVLPVLWWLLRVTPPAPRRIRFPALGLLLGLVPREETPAKTPLWLILMRMALAALIILALAHPLLNPNAQLAGSGPLVLVVDDDWAAARQWDSHRVALDRLIDQAERAGRRIVLLDTAPPPGNAAPPDLSLLRPADARAAIAELAPRPWPADRRGALDRLDKIDLGAGADVLWLSDGVEDGDAAAFAAALARRGQLRVMADAGAELPRLLAPADTDDKDLTAMVRRADAALPGELEVRAVGEDGRLLARQHVVLPAGSPSALARLAMPSELRNRAMAITIEGEAAAGATLLLDERWRRRPVGIVVPARRPAEPLLSGAYYLDKALSPFSEVRTGDVATLLKGEIAVLALADVAPAGAQEQQALTKWMAQGGTVLRFAGPHLAEQPNDDLLPVRLRGGGRTLGGALSWEKPAKLAPFAADGPFAGIEIPNDVTVSRQVLAEPALDLGNKTWARLTDGTPLVTAEKRGKGWLVLVHTTADPEWSNLAISGLFVNMLRRIVALSQGVAESADRALPPVETLDGFGRLQHAPATAATITAGGFASTVASARHPPGFYGTADARRALNLAPAVKTFAPLGELPPGVARESYASEASEVDFRPGLLGAALALALIDLVIAFALRGLLPRLPRRGAAAGAVLCLLVLGPAARAAGDDSFAIKATSELHLAYVRTGIAEVDEEARAGLSGLSMILNQRTAVDPAEPMAIDIERDEIIFFPLLYWPVVEGEPQPSAQAVERVNRYLATGGTILFDTRDQGESAPFTGSATQARLQRLAAGLNVPPLAPVPPDHVLTKSFYLMQEFPGRWAGGRLWVEPSEDQVNDGVSSVIVGGNDWAGAWAMGADGRPLYPVVPGGEPQREMAYRFGVNLVMYALTGNYKSDQVHVPAILERLGQ
ncbi:MAG TPA: DUF4159 domain-containing protein [Stellaceae bacterium]|nr:DUF4159 domain-containing protein [Stellaceae bacterium]